MTSKAVSRTRRFAEKAIGLMVERDIPPSPENFAIWYRYCDGSDAELKRMLDILISNDQEFDQFRNLSLFEQFILPKLAASAVGAVAQELDDAAINLNSAVQSAGENAEDYGRVLELAEGRLGPEADSRTIGEIVQSLLVETRNMQERNSNLQRDLASSNEMIAELRHKLAESMREAETDGLTDIANRKRFDRILRDSAMVAMENGTKLSLLMLDIDFFKKFNDTHGHQMGDQVLRLVAKTLTDSVRGHDLAARYGGEEFGVILPKAPLERAAEVGERIRRNLSQRKVVKRQTGETLGTITLSIGVATYEFGESITDLVKRADNALYEAKATGRNKVVTQEVLIKDQAG